MRRPPFRSQSRGVRALAYTPILNCFSLIYIGVTHGNLLHIVSGALYLLGSLLYPSLAVVLWIICTIHCSWASGTPLKNRTKGNTPSRHIEPTKPLTPKPEKASSTEYAQERFFKEMKHFEERTNKEVPFVPFMAYWPNYDSMSVSQQDWYFYWRSQVRIQNYIDTDLSYLFVYIYELLNGIGWKKPEEGYERLLQVWRGYQQRYNKLDSYLESWTYDFAMKHQLNYVKMQTIGLSRVTPSIKTDLMIEAYNQEIPLKLPFAYINALCDYAITGSKFYKDGNETLIKEAIPRVIALTDAFLRKETGKGLLETYGPKEAKEQNYPLFASAICREANQKVSVYVKAYSSHEALRTYVNELVRFGENTLRSIKGHKGRLRGVVLEERLSKVVEAFLKKEYATSPSTLETPKTKTITLDFESIDALREESNEVRAALEVEDIISEEPKALLTETAEISAIYLALSPNARAFMDQLDRKTWPLKKETSHDLLFAEINRVSEHYLGCQLLVCESNMIVVEDDYQDELEFLYKNPPTISPVEKEEKDFSLEVLNEDLKNVITYLLPEQRRALYCIVTEENVESQLEKIAESAMTMPQLLVDDINTTAMQVLGDILIDTDLQVSETYEIQLKLAIQ